MLEQEADFDQRAVDVHPSWRRQTRKYDLPGLGTQSSSWEALPGAYRRGASYGCRLRPGADGGWGRRMELRKTARWIRRCVERMCRWKLFSWCWRIHFP